MAGLGNKKGQANSGLGQEVALSSTLCLRVSIVTLKVIYNTLHLVSLESSVGTVLQIPQLPHSSQLFISLCFLGSPQQIKLQSHKFIL